MGRVAERAAITRLLDRAAAGRGGILVLIGRTGSGKSALLELTADLARDRGLDALGARGSVVSTRGWRGRRCCGPPGRPTR